MQASSFSSSSGLAIAARIARLTGHIIEWAGTQRDVTLVTSADPLQRAGIVTLCPGDTAGAADRLTRAGVAFAVREGGIRLAPHCYTTLGEVDAALRAIEGATR